MSARRLYISQCLILLAVATPLAIAEWNWVYLALSMICALVGWRRTIEQDRPLLSTGASRVIVITAFAYLIFEYFRVTAISVIALAHFMIVVCLTKMLQHRSYRDHAQFFVLSLLLLVVAAIVSGNLLFPVALAVFLTVGLDALIRFHLDIERTRAELHNRRIDWSNTVLPHEPESSLTTTRFTSFITLTSTSAGILIFVLCPRLAANSIFPRFESPRIGQSSTGFTNTLNLSASGPIAASDRPVMRVQIEVNGLPAGELPSGPYFRGAVLAQYRCEHPDSGTDWVWKKVPDGGGTPRGPVSRQADEEGYIELLRDAPLGDPAQILVQRYYLEPSSDNLNLFSCFAPLRLRSDSHAVEDVKKWVDDQTLQLQRPPAKPLRYTVESVLSMTPYVASLLAQERNRASEAEPALVMPETPLPRASEILELTAHLREGLASLDPPEARLLFAQRVRDFLQSSPFSWTLDRPQIARGVEPVGEFLLREKEGHCEYFASAMAVICQLHGVPARIVAGYCGGDYNPVGHFYVVRQKHAHSWVEVFVPGQDWVTFDPTPPAENSIAGSNQYLRVIGRYFDYLQFQWANLVVSYDADQRRSLFEKFSAWLLRPTQNQDTIVGAVSAFIRELFGWRLKLNWEERLIYWVFALLVLTLVLLIGYVLAVSARWVIVRLARFRRQRASPRPLPELEFYARFCHYLEHWGIARSSGQTPAELAVELARRLPTWDQAPDLVNAYYAVAFGGKRLSEAHRDRIEGFLNRLAAVATPPADQQART